jgi:hypothetical protein
MIIEVWEYWALNALLHYSITPSLHYSIIPVPRGGERCRVLLIRILMSLSP